MNKNIVTALFRDAFAQVVDNMMFRILIGLLMLCVLPTFLVGLREEEFVVLFYWRFPYEELLSAFGGSGGLPEDVRIQLIQGLQGLMVDAAAGTMGILLSVAATAFFIPRMLEKGAADTVFSKPVSRLSLMLSRYVAGLIFVTVLAVLLVGGMHLGFLIVSGYSDPGFLWSILTLIYVFAVMHGFSVMIGVFTRSSVAAILLTMIFFLLNSCVHSIWEVKESQADSSEDDSAIIEYLVVTSDVLHYTLPKTGDASRMARLLRRKVEDRTMELVDTGRTDLTVERAPVGFEREPRSSLIDEGALWIATDTGSAGEASVRLRLIPRDETEGRIQEARRFVKELTADPTVRIEDESRLYISEKRAEFVEWREDRNGEERLRRRWYFQSSADWIFVMDYDAEAEWAAAEEREQALEDFISGIRLPDSGDPFNAPGRYEREFGFDAEWKYNAWFSIGTTMAFLLCSLLIAWWKLSRIDF